MEHYTELVHRSKLGDADAFSKLYETIYRDLYRFALYTLKNSCDAEDVVSDAVMDAWQSIRSLRKAESFKAWIFKILTNKCRMRLKQYLNKTAELPEDLVSDSQDICQNLDVRTAFASLQEEERLILALNIFGGYSSKEIGLTLNLSDNTVRSKQSRALKKLQVCLAK